MVYDYIIENYKNGEPIFLTELPGDSKDYLRQEMKKLVDEGKLERLYDYVASHFAGELRDVICPYFGGKDSFVNKSKVAPAN